MTGGSKGLGKAMARGLAEAGADVVISSRHEDELEAASREIGAGLRVRVKYVVADLSLRAESPKLAAEAQKALGKIDILINNAGTNKPAAHRRDQRRSLGLARRAQPHAPAWRLDAVRLVPGMKNGSGAG